VRRASLCALKNMSALRREHLIILVWCLAVVQCCASTWSTDPRKLRRQNARKWDAEAAKQAASAARTFLEERGQVGARARWWHVPVG